MSYDSRILICVIIFSIGVLSKTGVTFYFKYVVPIKTCNVLLFFSIIYYIIGELNNDKIEIINCYNSLVWFEKYCLKVEVNTTAGAL